MAEGKPKLEFVAALSSVAVAADAEEEEEVAAEAQTEVEAEMEGKYKDAVSKAMWPLGALLAC